ncbi:MAG: DUF5715 family protein [Gemmatimonadaceae bacterium]
MSHRSIAVAFTLALIMTPGFMRADGLAGSPASMVNQHEIAVQEDYSFLRTSGDVRELASMGALVPVLDNENLALHKVSYAFARPEVRDFLERFAKSYRAMTGERLVVTSLTRPANGQPRNAHKLSVHPAGMAVDLRIPSDSAGRAFIERSLLAMERSGALDVTRERSPAHYHIAVFAGPYATYAAREDSAAVAIERTRVAAERAAAATLRSAALDAPIDNDAPLPGAMLGLLALLGVTAPLIFRGSTRIAG